MGKIIDLTGQRFGRLIVLSMAKDSGAHRETIWHCRCDCGKEVNIVGASLRHNLTKSCGCMRSEIAHKNVKWARQFIGNKKRETEEEVRVYIDRSQFDDWWMFGDFKEIERLRTMFH